MHKQAIACLSFSQKWGVKCKNVVNVRKSKFICPPFFCTLFVLTFRFKKIEKYIQTSQYICCQLLLVYLDVLTYYEIKINSKSFRDTKKTSFLTSYTFVF